MQIDLFSRKSEYSSIRSINFPPCFKFILWMLGVGCSCGISLKVLPGYAHYKVKSEKVHSQKTTEPNLGLADTDSGWADQILNRRSYLWSFWQLTHGYIPTRPSTRTGKRYSTRVFPLKLCVLYQANNMAVCTEQ